MATAQTLLVDLPETRYARSGDVNIAYDVMDQGPFDLLFVPGGGHGAGGAYYQRLLQDFFVHHLHGVEPPDWNKVEQNKTATATGN